METSRRVLRRDARFHRVPDRERRAGEHRGGHDEHRVRYPGLDHGTRHRVARLRGHSRGHQAHRQGDRRARAVHGRGLRRRRNGHHRAQHRPVDPDLRADLPRGIQSDGRDRRDGRRRGSGHDDVGREARSLLQRGRSRIGADRSRRRENGRARFRRSGSAAGAVRRHDHHRDYDGASHHHDRRLERADTDRAGDGRRGRLIRGSGCHRTRPGREGTVSRHGHRRCTTRGRAFRLARGRS